MNLSFREAGWADAAALASLSGELGYPVSVAEMQARLEVMTRNPDHAVLVACDRDGAAGTGAVIGWIDVGIVFHLQAGRYCEIGGLVVTASARRKGTGKALVAQAEEWLLVIKISAAAFPEVRDAIKELHSYDLPECVCIAIEDGSAEYLKWLVDAVR